MLKPFQIRDHQGSPSSSPVESSGIREVQISAYDYDNLASNHPRARLTYPDDDDGDQITVGSSLELAQRLDDEPQEVSFRHASSIQPSKDEPEPVHIFDIRRSNSVTELWKRFENQNSSGSQISETKKDIPVMPKPTVDVSTCEEPALEPFSATSSPGDDSQPFLAAFEAELANLLGSTEEPAEREPQAEPSPATESSTNTNSHRMPQVAEALAAQILHHLAYGANMVQSELRTRLPELQRQVRDAQRHLPENIGTSLQALLTTLEVHMRTAFNNIPDNGRQWADNGRQWAEEAIHAGRPVAENAAEGLRMMASEFNEVGRTLFATFEHEFGRGARQGANSSSNEVNTTPTAVTDSASSAPSASNSFHVSQPSPPDSKFEENPTTQCTKSQVAELATSSHATLSDARIAECLELYPLPPLPQLCPDISYSQPLPGAYPPAYPPPYLTPTPYQSSHSRFNNYHTYPHPIPPPPPKTPDFNPVGTSFPRAAETSHMSPDTYLTHGPWSLAKPLTNMSSGTASAQAEEPSDKTLFIGNVGFNVTERTIQDVFASKGFIVTVDLPLDAVTGKHAGFGYLHFPSIHPAMAAMAALQGTHIDGHAINLEFSDALPIRDVTNTVNQRPSPHELGSKAVGPSEAEQKESSPIKRRKSVTFKVSNTSTNETAPHHWETKSTTAQSTDAAIPPPLIDFSIDESACVPQNQQSSVANSHLQQANSTDGSDISLYLSSEPEMSRFPPVSQLEAQHLATQRRQQSTGTSIPIGLTASNNDHVAAFTNNLPGRSRTIHHVHGRDNRAHVGPGLRRASTMMFTPPRQGGPKSRAVDEASGASQLRRRASERQALRTNARPASELDTWARLDRRERERSRPSSQHIIPGSFTTEEAPQSTPFRIGEDNTQDVRISDCVSSLIDMGYGSVEDGGRSRMAIYAAASNGSLFDAIEMIEEERKAYAVQTRK
ncbi:hypothetical protein N7466_009108 [Penicillium verhagenii]|uniref:uncharacterized protein n=1 Tax=Penicillium verhagenii TaxID=1562060 RepID=UPI0025451915|nr:uncharacterized protein N7466_009108 [Penicillium verhagenii]KAJ5920782.1 hypothetical protein N7466_009108 [Penicillium verhagenii]